MTERISERDLLQQWLEGFRSEHGQYPQAQGTIEECESALCLHEKVVDAGRVRLLISKARNARQADGSCLEYGLDYSLEQLKGSVSELFETFQLLTLSDQERPSRRLPIP